MRLDERFRGVSGSNTAPVPTLPWIGPLDFLTVCEREMGYLHAIDLI
jgi:hypothetical protein